MKRIWVDDSLEEVLKELWGYFNDLSIKNTGRPIPTGWTITSQVTAEILKRVVNDLKKSKVDINDVGKNDKYISIHLNKIKKQKKNEILFT